MSLRAHFAKQSPRHLGDCFVGKNTLLAMTCNSGNDTKLAERDFANTLTLSQSAGEERHDYDKLNRFFHFFRNDSLFNEIIL
jgi:hypothetical protein